MLPPPHRASVGQQGMGHAQVVEDVFDQRHVREIAGGGRVPVAMRVSGDAVEADGADHLAPVMLAFAMVAQQPGHEQVDELFRCHARPI